MRIVAISAVTAFGITLALLIFVALIRSPIPIPVATVPPAPVCETPLAALAAKETLMLRRNGSSASLVIFYDGYERGALVTLDIETRTVIVPSRPPFGWKIGAR